MDEILLELAEEPGLWLPPEPRLSVERDGRLRARHLRPLGVGAPAPAEPTPEVAPAVESVRRCTA